MPWMKVDLNHNGSGKNWFGVPGILYDQNDNVIDTASDLSTYLDYLGIVAAGANIKWFNPCDQSLKAWSYSPYGYWYGDDFNIYPGQGIEINVRSDHVLHLKFGQGYKKHLICTETVAKYCEWSGQEEFDPLEG